MTGLDTDFLLDQEARVFRAFLADFGTGFAGKVPVGCLWGDRGMGLIQGFGFPARLLDGAKRHPTLTDELLACVATMTSHFKETHTFELPDGSWACPGETVLHHPVRSYSDYFDGDLARHQDFEWLSRWAEYGHVQPVELAARLGLRLLRASDPMRLRQIDFLCEGAHGRLRAAGNLVWLYRICGAPQFLEHAERLVLGALYDTQRGPTQAPHRYAPVPCWAGSDEFEQGRKNSVGQWIWAANPRADHRSASAWHIGDLIRFLVPVWQETKNPVVRQFLQDWVTVWAERAFDAYNRILDPGGGGAEFYHRASGIENWVWDRNYGADFLVQDTESIARRYYPFHATPPPEQMGPRANWQITYGWPDLFWLAFALTGQDRYQKAALKTLGDRRYYANTPDLVVVPERRDLNLYKGGNVDSGAGRGLAWYLTSGLFLPWWV